MGYAETMATKKMQAAPDAKELRQREKAAQGTAPDEVRMKAGGTSALTVGIVVLAGLAQWPRGTALLDSRMRARAEESFDRTVRNPQRGL